MSKLKAWILQEHKSVAEYCRRRGFQHEAVRRHCLPFGHSDFRLPSRDYMIAYYRDSRGAVRPDDFYDLPDLSTLPDEAAA